MNLVTRRGWNARAPKTNVGGFSSKKGFQLHWFASPKAQENHTDCPAQMRAVQNVHMAAPRNWSDIAYNFCVCNHGYVFEGRGWETQNGATGNVTANDTRIAMCWMGGTGDIFDIRAADAIHELVSEGINRGWPATVGGHRDFSQTTCPGDTLYGWMKAQVWTVTQPAPTPVPQTPILGVSACTQSQAIALVADWARASPYDIGTLSVIVSAYWNLGTAEGVRPDVALAQALKETGYFKYGGLVSADQWNFAGIGATGPGHPGLSFPSINAGVHAHVRRLRMYAAGTDALHDLTVLGRALPKSYWGVAPYLEQLNGKWAVPGIGYGESIVNLYLKPMALVPVTPTAPPSDWAVEAWAWAVNAGVVRGTEPQHIPTVEQVITYIYRARTVS